MAYLHFLWWGPFRATSCQTPMTVARACPRVDVVFWCKDSEVWAHRKAMLSVSNIQVRSCDSVAKVVGPTLAAGPDRDWMALAQRVIQLMDYYNAYAAAKDLLSMLILSTHGGYFMDTTMVVTDASNVQAKLLEQTAFARTAQLPAGPVVHSHVPRVLNPDALLMGWKLHGRLPEFKGLVDYSPSIEVWCMYGPGLGDLEGKKRTDAWTASAMGYAAKGYVARAKMMGLFIGAPPRAQGRVTMTTPRPLAPGAIATKYELDMARLRNTLIGQLAVQAVKDAMLNQDPKKVPSYRIPFDTVDIITPTGGHGKKGVLTGWGMEKHYAGSWRGATAPLAAAVDAGVLPPPPAQRVPAPVPPPPIPPVAAAQGSQR